MSRRILRALVDGHPRWGEIDGGEVRLLSDAPWNGGAPTGETASADGLVRLAPVTPSKVIAIAVNYRAHATEMSHETPEEPQFFMKPFTAVIGHGEAIRCPPQSENVHYEGELGIVIGRRLSRATPQEVREAFFGLTCLNDVTARDIQRRLKHHTRAKGFDTFCPVGPEIVVGGDFAGRRLRTRVNGEVKQDGNTSDMIFPADVAIAFVSQVMTLLPGDVVATGTPVGVGPIRPGDTVEVEIEGVGLLRNPVEAA